MFQSKTNQIIYFKKKIDTGIFDISRNINYIVHARD